MASKHSTRVVRQAVVRARMQPMPRHSPGQRWPHRGPPGTAPAPQHVARQGRANPTARTSRSNDHAHARCSPCVEIYTGSTYRWRYRSFTATVTAAASVAVAVTIAVGIVAGIGARSVVQVRSRRLATTAVVVGPCCTVVSCGTSARTGFITCQIGCLSRCARVSVPDQRRVCDSHARWQ